MGDGVGSQNLRKAESLLGSREVDGNGKYHLLKLFSPFRGKRKRQDETAAVRSNAAGVLQGLQQGWLGHLTEL